MDACCLCSEERAYSPCRLVEVSQLVPIVTDEMMMEIYTSAQIHYLSEQGWLQGCVAMHGHTLRHFCFVSSFIVLNRGGRESSQRRRRTQSSYMSFIIIYQSVDSSLTTWLVSDNTKHAGCRCEQSLSILISFQVELHRPGLFIIVRRRARGANLRALNSLGFRSSGCRFLSGLPHWVSRELFSFSLSRVYGSLFASIGSLGPAL
jgi:hypothetical protein